MQALDGGNYGFLVCSDGFTVAGMLEDLQRRFRGPGKLAAGRADVCPPMALNASQSATPSAPTADVQSAAGCDDQQ